MLKGIRKLTSCTQTELVWVTPSAAPTFRYILRISLRSIICNVLSYCVLWRAEWKKKIDEAVKYNLSNLIQLFLLRTLCMLGYASLAERRGIMRDDGHFTCQPDFSYSHSQFFLIAIFHSLRGERYVFASTCLTALNWFVKMCAWIMYSTFGCCTSKLIQSCGYIFRKRM